MTGGPAMAKRDLHVTRREGFYDVTVDGHMFRIERDHHDGGWTMRESFGRFGWSDAERFGSFRDAKEQLRIRYL